MLRPFRMSTLSMLILGSLSLAEGRAWASAPVCTVDGDCMHGFNCQVVGASTCPSPPPCLPGAKCSTPPACTTTETRGCVPGPCQSDPDCAKGMVCLSSTIGSCSGGGAACAPNTPCPAPPPPVCTTQTVSSCAPRYLAECHIDSDCGQGFLCVAQQACGCASSGSSSSGSHTTADAAVTKGAPPPLPVADGGAWMPIPPADSGSLPFDDGGAGTPISPDDSGSLPTPADDAGTSPGCSCAPSGHSVCQLQNAACAADGDCLSGWTCQAPPPWVCAGIATADGGSVPCQSGPPSMGSCVPPYWNTTVAGGGTFASTASSQDTTSAGAGGDSGAGAPPVAANPAGAGSTPAHSAGGGGGCALTPNRSGSGGSETLFVAFVSLLAVASRRRRV